MKKKSVFFSTEPSRIFLVRPNSITNHNYKLIKLIFIPFAYFLKEISLLLVRLGPLARRTGQICQGYSLSDKSTDESPASPEFLDKFIAIGIIYSFHIYEMKKYKLWKIASKIYYITSLPIIQKFSFIARVNKSFR